MIKPLLVLLLLVSSAATNDDVDGITWNKTIHHFGKIKRGDVVNTHFTLYNNTSKGLLIENVQASCGCVVTQRDRDTIQVGDSSRIEIKFDSKGKSGHHEKTITVYTSQGLFDLAITADIEKQ